MVVESINVLVQGIHVEPFFVRRIGLAPFLVDLVHLLANSFRYGLLDEGRKIFLGRASSVIRFATPGFVTKRFLLVVPGLLLLSSTVEDFAFRGGMGKIPSMFFAVFLARIG